MSRAFPRALSRGAGLLGTCLFVAAAAAGEEARLVPLFRHGTISDGVGSANLVAYDLDGDSRAELISCSMEAPFAVSARGDTYVRTGISPAADANADRRIGTEDLFVLINHEFAGGAPLQP